MATSPRKKKSIKTHAPRRCRKCPGQPLQSQCAHTVAGRKYLEQHSGVPTTLNAPPVTSSSLCLVDGPQQSALTYSSIDFTPPSLSDNGTSGGRYFNPEAGVLPQTPTPALIRSSSDAPMPTPPWLAASTSMTTLPEPWNFPIDPALEMHNQACTSSLMDSIPADLEGSSSSVQSTPSRESSRKNDSTPIRTRITRKNAIHQMVRGAMRGNKILEIPRTAPLRRPSESTSDAIQRFNREVANIIIRAERLSEETNCWLVLAAQQPCATSAVTHYTSSRLRKDAKEDTATLVNQFQKLTSNLLTAKREEALRIAKKLTEVEEAKKKADEESRAIITAQEAEIAQKDALIAHYKAMYHNT